MKQLKINPLSAPTSTIQRKRSVQEMMQERRKLKKLEQEEIRYKLKRKHFTNKILAASCIGSSFCNTKEWKQLRYRILVIRGHFCEACGRGPKDGACIQVDHILPRYLYPEKAFDPDNLQVLCKECNEGKGVLDKTRWSKVIRRKKS